MPLGIFLIWRLLRAIAASVRLFSQPRVLRGLPWSYLRTLPRRDRWTGFVFLMLVVSTSLTVLAAALPSKGGTAGAAGFALMFGFAGVFGAWIRGLSRR